MGWGGVKGCHKCSNIYMSFTMYCDFDVWSLKSIFSAYSYGRWSPTKEYACENDDNSGQDLKHVVCQLDHLRFDILVRMSSVPFTEAPTIPLWR